MNLTGKPTCRALTVTSSKPQPINVIAEAVDTNRQTLEAKSTI